MTDLNLRDRHIQEIRLKQKLRAANHQNVLFGDLTVEHIVRRAIAIEINPVDSAGSATKKRGIVVRSASELDEFNRIVANQKLVELARKVDQVNPKQKEAPTATGSNVFEI